MTLTYIPEYGIVRTDHPPVVDATRWLEPHLPNETEDECESLFLTTTQSILTSPSRGDLGPVALGPFSDTSPPPLQEFLRLPQVPLDVYPRDRGSPSLSCTSPLSCCQKPPLIHHSNVLNYTSRLPSSTVSTISATTSATAASLTLKPTSRPSPARSRSSSKWPKPMSSWTSCTRTLIP